MAFPADEVETDTMSSEATGTTVDVVILVASAGGLDALCSVLARLPADYPASVVIHQHLGGRTSVLPAILSRQTNHDVRWVVDGERLRPHDVRACPPDVYTELKPDGSFSLRAREPEKEQRFDVLLSSAAASYGPRALAVVLSGSGHDGAAGTAAMKRAGGIVIAQSRETAEYPSMPMAAAHAGADLVLPVDAIGPVLTEIGLGGPITPSELGDVLEHLGIPCTTGAESLKVDAGQQESGPNTTLRASESPGARAEAARRRVAELQQCREDLASGVASTAQAVTAARARAEDAARRAQMAHEAAAEQLSALEAAKQASAENLHQQ